MPFLITSLNSPHFLISKDFPFSINYLKCDLKLYGNLVSLSSFLSNIQKVNMLLLNLFQAFLSYFSDTLIICLPKGEGSQTDSSAVRYLSCMLLTNVQFYYGPPFTPSQSIIGYDHKTKTNKKEPKEVQGHSLCSSLFPQIGVGVVFCIWDYLS